MQDRPTAEELLSAIATLLQGDVLEATQGALQHQVRVAGNLSRILEREAQYGAEHERREIELLARVLGEEPGGRDARALAGALVERLDAGPDHELEIQDRLRVTEDFREGVAAMSERRIPNFQGR